jgi:Tfp pilus assembly protein PilP
MTMKMRLAFAAVLATQTTFLAQSGPVGSVATTAVPAPADSQPVFVYQVDGRRDPFVDLFASDAGTGPGQRGVGLAGLVLAEATVRGIMESNGSLIAMVQGPDNRTYIVRAGDKLADSVVTSVTPQGLILVQDIVDPLSRHRQQEVRKLLRSTESTKP